MGQPAPPPSAQPPSTPPPMHLLSTTSTSTTSNALTPTSTTPPALPPTSTTSISTELQHALRAWELYRAAGRGSRFLSQPASDIYKSPIVCSDIYKSDSKSDSGSKPSICW